MPTFREHTSYTPSKELEEVYELRRKAQEKRKNGHPDPTVPKRNLPVRRRVVKGSLLK